MLEDIPKKEEKVSADFIRHSISSYKTYAEIMASEEPMQQFNPNEQLTPDLLEKGVALAKQEAEKFFATMDPEKDLIFFASSDEARAVETANIYRQVAHEKGFEIVKPEHSRSKLSDEIAEGEIRIIQNLSIYGSNSKSNAVIDSVFNPPEKRGETNWDAIDDPELKIRFKQASAIIEADDRGSFGPNFVAHGEEVKKIFPEITTAEELYKNQFGNLIKLLKFGLEKTQSAQPEKNVKILAFGHENYLMHALEKLLQEDGIKNCETMHFSIDDEGIKAKFRGKEAQIE